MPPLLWRRWCSYPRSVHRIISLCVLRSPWSRILSLDSLTAKHSIRIHVCQYITLSLEIWTRLLPRRRSLKSSRPEDWYQTKLSSSIDTSVPSLLQPPLAYHAVSRSILVVETHCFPGVVSPAALRRLRLLRRLFRWTVL